MHARTKSATVLLVLLIACIGSTAVHYTDNTISIDKYPQAEAVSRLSVALVWLLLTPAGVLGYRLYSGGRMLPAYACLTVYSITGISTPAHYLQAGFSDFAFWRNASILTDGVTGVAILAFVLWSMLFAKEWAQPSPVRRLAS